LLRTGTACLRSPPRFPSDARPSELFPSEKRFPRHRESLPPCRSPATPLRLRGLLPLGNPLRRRFVAESHHPLLSWASPPGAPPEHAAISHVRERTAWMTRHGPAQARADRVAESATPTPPQPKGHDHIGCAGEEGSERHHCRVAMPGKRDRLHRRRSDVLADPRAKGDGLSPMADLAAPREITGRPPARLARERAHRVSIRTVPGSLRRVGSPAEADDPSCSTAFREVGGSCRWGPRCQWVDQVSVRLPGSGDRSEGPRIGEAKEVSSERHGPRGPSGRACRIAATRRVPNVGV